MFDKLHEEIDEVRAEFAHGADRDAAERRNRRRAVRAASISRGTRKVDARDALRHANAKFERRFRRMEALAAEAGETLPGKSLAEQDALWDRAKAEERRG